MVKCAYGGTFEVAEIFLFSFSCFFALKHDRFECQFSLPRPLVMLLCVLFNVKDDSTNGVSNTLLFLPFTNLDVSMKKEAVLLFPRTLGIFSAGFKKKICTQFNIHDIKRPGCHFIGRCYRPEPL